MGSAEERGWGVVGRMIAPTRPYLSPLNELLHVVYFYYTSIFLFFYTIILYFPISIQLYFYTAEE